MVYPKYIKSWRIDGMNDIEHFAGDRFLPILREYWREEWLEDEREELIDDTEVSEFLDYLIESLPEVYINDYNEYEMCNFVYLIEFPYDQNDIKWWKR